MDWVIATCISNHEHQINEEGMMTDGSLFNYIALSTIGKESGVLSELWEASNGQVFLVRV